jgi:hypothetical protein
VLKRLIGWLIVAILASTLITSCASTGSKDCKILLEAKERLNYELDSENNLEDSIYTSDSLADYFLTLQENQLVFQEPKVREHVLDFISDIDTLLTKPNDRVFINWSEETNRFVNRIDNFCNSL